MWYLSHLLVRDSTVGSRRILFNIRHNGVDHGWVHLLDALRVDLGHGVVHGLLHAGLHGLLHAGLHGLHHGLLHHTGLHDILTSHHWLLHTWLGHHHWLSHHGLLLHGDGVSGHGNLLVLDLGDSGGCASLVMAVSEGCSLHSLLMHTSALNSHHDGHDAKAEEEARKRPPEPGEIVVVTIRGISASIVVPTAVASTVTLKDAIISITGIVSTCIIVVITTKLGVFGFFGGDSEDVSVFHSNCSK